MNKNSTFSVEVARKHKRLKYWSEKFAALKQQSDFSSKLDIYRLLISKLVKAEDEKGREEALSRLDELERELASSFERLRLFTSRDTLDRIASR